MGKTAVITRVVAILVLCAGVCAVVAVVGLHASLSKLGVVVSDMQIENQAGELVASFTMSGTNPLPLPLHLTGVSGRLRYGTFITDVMMTFPSALVLSPGQYRLVVEDMPLRLASDGMAQQVAPWVLKFTKGYQMDGVAMVYLGPFKRELLFKGEVNSDGEGLR